MGRCFSNTNNLATDRQFFTYQGVGSNGGLSVGSTSLGSYSNPVLGPAFDIQAAIELQKSVLSDDIVFMMSQPDPGASAKGYVEVMEPITTVGYYQTKENMKMRIYNSNMRVSFKDIFYENESIYTKQNIPKSGIAKVERDSKIQLRVEANSGGGQYGTNTISAFVTDSTGKLKYVPLNVTSEGINGYELDLAGLELKEGVYSIQVVNEQYSTDLTMVSPADCSRLSEILKIEIKNFAVGTFNK